MPVLDFGGDFDHVARAELARILAPLLIISAPRGDEQNICPPRWVCQLLRQAGAKVTFATGQGIPVSILSQTSPLKFSLSNLSPAGKIKLSLKSAICIASYLYDFA